MKKYNKIFVYMCAFSLLIAVFLGILITSNKNILSKNEPYRVKAIQGSFDFAISDPASFVGEADYVFVARVDKYVGTEYRNIKVKETEDGFAEAGWPYTNYLITVLKNIKGELILNTQLPICKEGGLSMHSQNTYELWEEDFLPVENNIYVFLAYAQNDGSLLISGPYANIKMNLESTVNLSDELIMRDPIYKKYENAYQNQVISERKRAE